MKNQIVKSLMMGALLVFFSMTGFSQAIASLSYSDSVRIPEKVKVPQKVTDAFAKQYPVTTNETWTAFPANGYTNDWFDDTYSSVDSSRPNADKYYVVSYTVNKMVQKSIYSTDGTRIATHCTLTEDVPKPVSDAISSGEYKSWEVDVKKEEIFKQLQTDTMKVYKVKVTKGNEKRTLFYQADGKLLKSTKV